MDEVFVGQIMLLPFMWAPYGTVACDGSLLSITQNQALYALIGNVYGGSQSAGNFAVPNLRGAEPNPHMQYVVATMGIFPTRP
jgi:microcystin-dependent protein